MFSVNRSQACRWVHEFMPVLMQTLDHEAVQKLEPRIPLQTPIGALFLTNKPLLLLLT